ncbi:hypothetical protein [Bacillus atrophaeus]|uniref:hypothetical protein n=1 Tax=Bacillus atrophaeus TaxID=1452 RepID=UPI0030F42C66
MIESLFFSCTEFEGVIANAGAAETSKAIDKAEPVNTFFNLILNTPLVVFSTPKEFVQGKKYPCK